MQTNFFSAEYGQTGGAVVNMVTRSGTNDLHGTGYYFLRDAALNANDWFSNRAGRALPAFHRDQYGGVIGGPILSAYPGLDGEMLPLALIVVILGGVGSLLGAFVGSFIIGFIYTFGIALLPDLAYVILFLPMIFVIAFRPMGLFGRMSA